MERLFSPWRSQYIKTFSQPNTTKAKCVLCAAYKDKKDNEHFIVTRGKHCFVIMNLFPYNSGHVMIVPYRHVPSLTNLTDKEMTEAMKFLQKMIKALQKVSHPEGFNIGSNIGRSAGAGIDHHIHFHIVPRWNGDTNFMPTLADTKMISEDMKETLMKLRKAL
ncbi:MAG: HIT domain-containing protein [Ignavibacteria bacterium]|nr:HIT domain-containing protein [Ignavibacteria bacterium]MBI3766071.1 HIT domain-containing protein [Ignavibacteriales bacterium]